MSETQRDLGANRPLAILLLAGLAIGSAGATAMGDRILVRGGGQIRGKLIADPGHPGQYLFIGEVGKTPMPFARNQIVQVIAEQSPLDEYVARITQTRSTAEAEFELGEWCERNKLADLAQVHWEQALKIDSTFDPAHRKLGHVLMGGRWLNGEEVKEAQGMVKYRGRWMTPEEKERREQIAATAAEGNSWVKKIRLLREAYLAGPVDRAREAERRLMAIEEPIAIGPVLKVLGDDPIPGLRALASRVIGVIPGPEASMALVARLLGEDDQDVRQETMQVLARREASEVIPVLARGLRSSLHQVVNRAAWGLGNLKAVVAVPALIPVLITYEYEVMIVNNPGATPPSGVVGGQTGFGNYVGRSIATLTGPVVGPGVVAYGATSNPGSFPGGASIGGGGASGGPTPRLVQIECRNDEVLASLVKLTGCNFGYDVPSWNQWMTTSFKVESKPSRRVPEP